MNNQINITKNESLYKEIQNILRKELSNAYLTNRYLTVDEAQKVLKCGKTKMYELMGNGSIPFTGFPAGRRLIAMADIDKVMEANKNDPKGISKQ